MRGTPAGFWGKLDRAPDGNVCSWHPLEAHCADVAACCKVLLERTSLGVRLAHLAGLEYLEPCLVDRLCVMAALHDCGKFSIGFQNKALRSASFTCGHVEAPAALLARSGGHSDALLDALGANVLSTWGEGDAVSAGVP